MVINKSLVFFEDKKETILNIFRKKNMAIPKRGIIILSLR